MDLSVRIDFLTGRYIATDASDRAGHEWPAHPNRFFSASVAALHDGEDVDAAERDALCWVETLGAPSIIASDAESRAIQTHFVPTNDVSIIGAANQQRNYKKISDLLVDLAKAPSEKKRISIEKKIEKAYDVNKWAAWDGKDGDIDILPESRSKKPRFYPSVTPEVPTQWLVWRNVDEKMLVEHRDALERVFARIARLGHSSSFVSVSIADSDQEPNWVPDRQGDHLLRTVTPGQLEQLEADFVERAHHVSQDEKEVVYFSDIHPRIMPNHLTRYRKGNETHPERARSNESGEWIAFEYLQGKRFPVSKTFEVCRAVRAGLMAYAPNPRSPYLSGHEPDGSPTDKPHLKVIAPAFVKGRYASGLGMGIALILPETDQDEDRLNVYRAIGAWESAGSSIGMDGAIRLFTSGDREAWFRRTLRPERKTMLKEGWSRPACVWETSTPIALDRNPKFFGHPNAEKHERSVERAIESVRQACRSQGLPEPVDVQVSRRPFFKESADAKAFGPVSIGGRQRFLLHARIVFDQPVVGPLVLGAGRFFGLGFCSPRGK